MKVRVIMKVLVLIGLFTAIQAQAETCAAHLQAITIWEDEINNQIVTKNTQFPISDWDPNASFDGIILSASASKNVKEPVLEVEYIAKSKSKKKFETFKGAKAFDQEPMVKLFEDFKPREFFSIRQTGHFKITLKDGNTVICSESHVYSLGH